ncbi:hypothetical protein Tco_0066367 [Tanacetum coccineum]
MKAKTRCIIIFMHQSKITKSILSKWHMFCIKLHGSQSSFVQTSVSAFIAKFVGSASNSLVQSMSSLLSVATKAFEFESFKTTILLPDDQMSIRSQFVVYGLHVVAYNPSDSNNVTDEVGVIGSASDIF